MPITSLIEDLLKKIPASLTKPKLKGKELAEAVIKESKFKTDYIPSEWRKKELLPTLNEREIPEGISIESLRKGASDKALQDTGAKITDLLRGKAPLAGVGVTAGAVLMEPEEAEAMPLGKLRNLTRTLKTPSSAEIALKGKTIGDKIVKGVKQEGKKWRVVQFEDGTEIPMTTDYLNDLMRITGTQSYLKEFSTQGVKGKSSMANRSLETRLSRPQPMSELDYIKENQFHKDRVNEIASEIGVDPGLLNPKTSYVKWPKDDRNARLLQLPSEYAEILEKEGVVTIVREPR